MMEPLALWFIATLIVLAIALVVTRKREWGVQQLKFPETGLYPPQTYVCLESNHKFYVLVL